MIYYMLLQQLSSKQKRVLSFLRYLWFCLLLLNHQRINSTEKEASPINKWNILQRIQSNLSETISQNVFHSSFLDADFNNTSNESQLVWWNETIGKCSPDICGTRNILEIPGFNGFMTQNMVEKYIGAANLFDANRARQCLKDTYIVLIGDSSMSETFHDLVVLLNRLAVSEQFDLYVNESVHHSTVTDAERSVINPEFHIHWKENPNPCDNNSREDLNKTDSIPEIFLDPKHGHRNATLWMADSNILIRYRYNGHFNLGKGSVGVLSMFIGKGRELYGEYKCLLGVPGSGCRAPDIVIMQSGHHDLKSMRDYGQRWLPLITQSLKEAIDRGIAAYWLTTSDYSGDLIQLKELNDVAKRICAEKGVPVIDKEPPAQLFSREFRSRGLTQEVFQSSHSHVGLIQFKGLTNLTLSSYMTQYLLSQICTK